MNGRSRSKIFGVGLPRTASRSVLRALAILGFGPTHGQAITLNRVEKVRATKDIWIAANFEDLDKRYPGSKFILTLRPVEPWLHSIRAIYRSMVVGRRSRLTDYQRTRRYRFATEEAEKKLWDSKGYLHMPTDDEFLFGRIRHHKHVLEYFKHRSADFLEFNVFDGDGWQKLASFFGTPAPKRKFPHVKG